MRCYYPLPPVSLTFLAQSLPSPWTTLPWTHPALWDFWTSERQP